MSAEGSIVSGDVTSVNCQLTGQISALNAAKLTLNGGGYTISGRQRQQLRHRPALWQDS